VVAVVVVVVVAVVVVARTTGRQRNIAKTKVYRKSRGDQGHINLSRTSFRGREDIFQGQ